MSQFLQDLGLQPTVSRHSVQLSQWVEDLLPTPGKSGVPDLLTEPMSAAVYLNGIRDVIQATSVLRPLIRVADSNLQGMWELDGEISASVEDLMDDTGKCTVTVAWQNWMQQLLIQDTMLTEDVNLLIDMNPTKPNWRTRWGGKITEIQVKKDDKGIHTIVLTALHFREHAKRLLVAANPIFPPEIQLPRMWVLPGPCRTVLAITAFINLARLFMPGWSTITNVFNPFGWIDPFNPDAVLNVLPTEWPIQVAFVDTALDTSRWTSLGATWTDWHSAFKDILADSGCIMRCYTYLTTDEDSPNDELAHVLNTVPNLISRFTGLNLDNFETHVDKLAAPRRNSVVFSFQDISGVTGPTGTVADGLLDTVAVTLDDLITPITINLATGNIYDPGQMLNGESVESATGVDQTYLFEQLLDVAPAPPQVIWWDGTYNGMISTELTYHKGSPKTMMTGSKSPVIVNEAETFAIRYGLAQLSDVINTNLAEVSDAGETQVTGTPGLDNLYNGQLNDTLFAWERFTSPIRALYAGDVAWQEHFERGSGTAYTLSSLLTMRSGNWKTRTFAAFQADTIDGHPWIADYDYFLGDRVGYEQDGIIYVDNVYGIKREWDWQKPLTVKCKIGEDKQKGDPVMAGIRMISNVYNLLGELAGEGTIFAS